jgi:hypothetical protein
MDKIEKIEQEIQTLSSDASDPPHRALYDEPN